MPAREKLRLLTAEAAVLAATALRCG